MVGYSINGDGKMNTISGEKHWKVENLKYAMSFYHGEISEEAYILYHEDCSAKYWFEIKQLKELKLFYPLIQKGKVKLRRRILFDRENTGLTYDKYKEFLRIGDQKLNNFINLKNVKTDSVDLNFAANMAMISRVPWDWLFFDNVNKS